MYYALINMTLLNGHKDMVPEKGRAVIVRDGRIEAVVSESELPADIEKVDLNGGWLLPGFINMHMHVPASGKPKKKQMNYEKVAKLMKSGLVRAVYRKVCEANVRKQLFSGVTTVRAVGGLPSFDTRIRDKINAGKITGPRILAADYAVSVPGGHMTGSVALPAKSAEEAVAMVNDLHEKYHPDLIKLMITGGVLDCTVPGEPGILRMPPEYVNAACARAHELGYKVAAHVESTEGMKVALEGGVDTIEHGGKPTDEIIELFKKTGSVLIATLSPTVPFLGLRDGFLGVSDIALINGRALYKSMLECIKRCREEGIPVGLGTDTGCPYITHYGFWRELWYYNRLCGVSPEETIYSATLLNAEIAGIADETGFTFGKVSGIPLLNNILIVCGILTIAVGVILLAVVEQKLSKEEAEVPKEKRKYRFGALALIFPILYCVFDTLGTAADGIILNEESGLGLGEIDVIVLYGLTFFLAGIAAWIFLWIREKKPYNPFSANERWKGVAAVCEEFGQIFYVYAMASKPVLAAPMVASYCIVSVLLSRIFLKEKLKSSQYACAFAVIVGILMLGISEGIGEM